jgi:hypothetical protein
MRCSFTAAATVALLSLGLGQAALASPVTWVYQGQVATTGRADALPAGSLVNVALAFDSSAPDFLPADPGCGVYQGTATTTVAGLAYTGAVFLETDVSGCGRPDGNMYVVGVAPSGPSIPYPALAPPASPLFSGIPASRVYLETGLTGPGDGLPGAPPAWMFFELIFSQVPCGYYCGGGDPFAFTVTASLTPVPEPLSVALVSAGLAAFLVRRRASTRQA